MLLFLAALALLYLRAEAVRPEQHFAYTQHLRDLREIDARIDAELLANRLELSRNYDALTDYTRQSLAAAGRILQAPGFISDSSRKAMLSATNTLQATLERKADMIDLFKRNDSVLRNSLAYFPVAAANLLDAGAEFTLPAAGQTLDRYVRAVLTFARTPGESSLEQCTNVRDRINIQSFDDAQRLQVENLLHHGDLIVKRLSDLNRLTQEIPALQSGRQLETLHRHYVAGHGEALAQAGRYRTFLYGLLVLLSIFLVWTFARLDRTRRSLEIARRQVNDRYAAQLAAEAE